MAEKIKKNDLCFLGLGTLFSAVLLVWFLLICTEDSISYDNSYQYFLNLHSWKEMFSLILVDYSPPLYSVVLKLFSMVFGTGLVTVRVLSLILLCSLFFFALFPLRRLMGSGCALTAAVLFLASSYNFYFGVAIRPTILAYVLTTGMFIYAALAFFSDKKSDLTVFTVLSILCMYTHNVSLIAAFCIYASSLVTALVRRRMDVFKRFLISGITVAVLYIPWLIVLITQTGNVSDHFWVSNDSLPYGLYLALMGYVGNLANDVLSLPSVMLIILLPFINIFLLLGKDDLKNAKGFADLLPVKKMKTGWPGIHKLLYLLLTVCLSVTIFYLVTEFVAPIFARRYFFIFSGAGIVILSSLATLCKNRKVPAVLLSVFAVFTFVFNTYEERKIIDMSDRDLMIADINGMTGSEPGFIDLYEETLGVTSYYFRDSKHYVTEDTFTVLPDFDVFGTDTVYMENGDDLWDYTDEVLLFSAIDFEYYDTDPVEYYLYYFKTPQDVELNYIGHYNLPYTNEIGYGIYDIDLYRVCRKR